MDRTGTGWGCLRLSKIERPISEKKIPNLISLQKPCEPGRTGGDSNPALQNQNLDPNERMYSLHTVNLREQG
uniref:Uncharacterized protein n=1 Tax=Salix viminalis TaxID=40686 RepID=A0A6N2KSX8_SALVM